MAGLEAKGREDKSPASCCRDWLLWRSGLR